MKFSREFFTQIRTIAVNSAICIVLYWAVWTLQSRLPVQYVYLNMEDWWGEYASFSCFLLSGLMTLGAVCIHRKSHSWGHVCLGLGLVIIAMEEISWGQRFFSYQTPTFMAAHNYQGEMTFHNVHALRSAKADVLYYVLGAWSVLIPILSVSFYRFNWLVKKAGIPCVPLTLLPYFILSIFIFKRAEIVNSQEISEQLFGLAFLIYAHYLLMCSFLAAKKNRPDGRVTLGVALLAAFCLTAVCVQIRPTEEHLKRYYLNHYAGWYFPENQLYGEAQQVFQYLLEHPQYKTDETWMNYGKFLLESNHENAQTVLRQALKEQMEWAAREPDNARPRFVAGKIFKLLNLPQLAREKFQESVVIGRRQLSSTLPDWDRVEAMRALAESYSELGERTQAIGILQEADTIVSHAWQKQQINDALKKLN